MSTTNLFKSSVVAAMVALFVTASAALGDPKNDGNRGGGRDGGARDGGSSRSFSDGSSGRSSSDRGSSRSFSDGGSSRSVLRSSDGDRGRTSDGNRTFSRDSDS